MKKNISFILLFLLFGFILYATLVNKVVKKEINVPSSISLTQREISEPGNIARWYLPFAGADTSSNKIVSGNVLSFNNTTLNITRVTGLNAWYNVSENGHTKELLFSIAADTGNTTRIALQYESTLWGRLTGNSIAKNAEASLQNLKDYFSDTKKMYGYQIEVIDVSDTAFLFTSKVVARKDKKEAFTHLFESLIQQAKEKDLGYNGVRIFYYSPFGEDSIHLFTSIGITNSEGVGLTGEFSLKKMPFKGHLLEAYYQGSFGEVQKVITALNQFQADNSMTIMAIPFVKLISDGITFDDSQVIQAKVYSPFFK